MSPAQYYIERGMRNLQVNLPRAVRQALVQRSRQREEPLWSIYEECLRHFVRRQRRPTARSPRMPYLAPGRLTKTGTLQMWLAASIYQDIVQLARSATVSKRSVAYTALMVAFPPHPHGVDDEKTEAETTPHRRRR
jgi:hypothetical protein